MVFRTLANLTSKRIPMIKFRKGGLPQQSAGGAGQVLGDSTASTTVGAPQYQSAGPIEDWELPPRFWRKPISPEECAFINRGGPE